MTLRTLSAAATIRTVCIRCGEPANWVEETESTIRFFCQQHVPFDADHLVKPTADNIKPSTQDRP
jgi:hypothetical protein